VIAQGLIGCVAIACLNRLNNACVLCQSIGDAPLYGQGCGRQKRHRAVHKVKLLHKETVVRGKVDLFVKTAIGAA